jgi:SAM-dependent methyltransferase
VRQASTRQSGRVSGSFSGTTAAYYTRYRRGYPDQVVDAVVDRLHLSSSDFVVDLGCGTGLLTAPVARRVRFVVGIDPEPDMLTEARRALDPLARSRVVWVMGSDADLPAVAALRGEGGWGAVLVGQALHLMDHPALFRQARQMLRPGGGLAIISNGIPLWQQDSGWSRSLKSALQDWFQAPLSSTCGTAEADRAQYRSALHQSGFVVEQVSHNYDVEITFEELIGGLFSAVSPTDLPAERRHDFIRHIAEALSESSTFIEAVPVTALVGIIA